MFDKFRLKIARSYFDNGEYLDNEHKYNDAILQYKKAIQIYPKYNGAYDNLGKDYFAVKNYRKSILIYKRLIQLNPQNGDYYNSLGLSYAYINNYQQAALNYKRAINLDDDEIYYVNLAGADEGLNNYKGATWAYRQAIKLAPQNASYYNYLGAAYSYINGNGKQAADNYRKAINLNNTHALYYANLGLIDLKTLYNYKESAWAYQQAVKLAPRSDNYYNYLGQALYHTGDFNDAKKNYHKAIQLNDNNASYYDNLGEVNDKLRQYADEIEAYETALKLAPENDAYFNHLGVAYSRINNNVKARINYQNALNIKKKPIYYDNLAGAFNSLKKYRNAVDVFTEGLKEFPQSKYVKDFYNGRAGDFYNLRKFHYEIKDLKSLLKMDPGNDSVLNKLGVAYDSLHMHKRAVKYYKKAIARNSSNDLYFSNLARAYSNLHNYNAESQNLQQAMRINPKDQNYKNRYNNINNEERQYAVDQKYSQKINPDINYQNYFDGLIGLDDVKKKLDSIILDYKVNKARTNRDDHEEIHLIFEGAPGTGKTTVAKTFSKILYQAGVVKSTHYVSLNATELSGKYQGDGTKKAKDSLKHALNGVLFIDEAYSLASQDSNVKQAVDTLMTGIENHKNDIVVILAGYTKPMENLLNNVNPGLRSRFPTVIRFNNYSNEECFRIFKYDMKKDNLRISSLNNCESVLKREFYNWASIKKSQEQGMFGNARAVRNLYGKLRSHLDYRIGIEYGRKLSELKASDPEILNTVTLKDVKNTFEHRDQKTENNHDYVKDLDNLIGLDDVKKQIHNYINQVKGRKRLSDTGTHGEMHLVFEGSPGTGKTTVAKLFSKILYQKNVISSSNYVEINATNLESTIIGGSAKKARNDVQNAMGGVLFIDEAYAMASDDSFMKQAVDTLMTGIENHKNDIVVILAGYTKPMENMLNNVNPGLRSRFPTVIKFPNYSNEDCWNIFKLDLHKDNLRISSDNNTEATLKADLNKLISIKRAQAQDKFGNARTVRNIYDTLKDYTLNRIAKISEDRVRQLKAHHQLNVVTISDVTKAFKKYGIVPNQKAKKHDYVQDLNQLIGLKEVKDQIKSYIRTSKMNKVLGDSNSGGVDLVFEGSPGTGKTTVARLFAHILYDIGIVKSDKFKEIQGSDLTGEYLGQTKVKARKLIHSALGGLLFVDEAYTLAHDPHGSGGTNDYKDAALAELVAEVENHRKDLAVILAGYTPQMKAMFKYSNPGLKSRFRTKIIFPNYSNEECFEILQLMFKNKHVKIADKDTENLLKLDFIRTIQKEKEIEKDEFGNGRSVRNIVQKLIAAKNNRWAVLPIEKLIDIKAKDPIKLHTVTSEDVRKVFKN